MEKDFKEQDSNEDDWGNPPAPLTPENQRKAFRAQMIIGIVAFADPASGIMFWVFRK